MSRRFIANAARRLRGALKKICALAASPISVSKFAVISGAVFAGDAALLASGTVAWSDEVGRNEGTSAVNTSIDAGAAGEAWSRDCACSGAAPTTKNTAAVATRFNDMR